MSGTASSKLLNRAAVVVACLLGTGLACVTVVAWSRDIAYALRVHEPRVAITRTELIRSSAGLVGASLFKISESPVDPRHLLAAGVFSYVSSDAGEHWSLIGDEDDRRSNYPRIHWDSDGSIVRVRADHRLRSTDLGRAWKNEGTVELTAMPNAPTHSDTVSGLPYPGNVTTLSDGTVWAATAAGAFSKKPGDTAWRYRSHGMSSPSIRRTALAPDGSEHVLAVDTARRVWKSEDFGETWAPLGIDAAEVEFVVIDGRPRPVLVRDNLDVVVVDRDGPREIGPPKLLRQSQDGRRLGLCVVHATESQEIELLTSWLCGSSEAPRFPYRPMASDTMAHNYRILKRSAEGLWTAHPFDRSFFTRAPVSTEGCRLHELDRNLDIGLSDGKRTPEVLETLAAVVKRAGWLPDGRYYSLDDGHVQLGRPDTECQQESFDLAWSWEAYSYSGYFYFAVLGPYHAVLVRQDDDTVEVLLPALDGFWRTRVEPNAFPLWRVALHWLVHNLVLAWGGGIALISGIWRLARRSSTRA
ncbi:MAG: hypothetical protein AAFQ65_07520 [Myxococcota bacterium]